MGARFSHWQITFQKNGEGIGYTGQNEYVALFDGVSRDVERQIRNERDAYQHARQIRRAHSERRPSAQAPQPEMFALKESLAFHRGCGLYHRRYETDRPFRKINEGYRLIDLESPRLSCLRINMIPVLQAKRYVAILLNLEHDKVATERMNRACAQENGVARFRR